MGYRSDFDFSYNKKEVIDAINDIIPYPGEDGIIEGAEWYDKDEDLKAISNKLINETIRVRVRGEHFYDVYTQFFLNGAECKILYTLDPEAFPSADWIYNNMRSQSEVGDRGNPLYNKYKVERRDGKPLKGDRAIVLELGDPNAWSAINEFADTTRRDGYHLLAADLGSLVKKEIEKYYKEQ